MRVSTGYSGESNGEKEDGDAQVGVVGWVVVGEVQADARESASALRAKADGLAALGPIGR